MNPKKEIKKSGYCISLTPSVASAADRMSMRDGDSRSNFIEKLIKREMERRAEK